MGWRSTVVAAACMALGLGPAGAASPWGADYFPNVVLTTHDGRAVRFFDDLIEDRIVVVNFIYTSCADTCPLETAQLVAVQNVLGDRLGRDVFFYSITIDPEHDTPAVLARYRERFGARWTFLTGDEVDITALRRKLGLYIEEIQDGSNNHNVNMIIGNQATGRWMRRSPFENPHVLADQLVNWLDGWRSRPRGESYASAPALRSISRGEQIFRTRCVACHSMTGSDPPQALGPDLLGVTKRREWSWLLEWLRAPDRMLEDGDPIALALYEKYDQLAMPNMRLNQEEALALLEYIDDETQRQRAPAAGHGGHVHVSAAHAGYNGHQEHRDGPMHTGHPEHTRVLAAAGSREETTTAAEVAGATPSRGDVVAVANAWVREAHLGAEANAGYMTLVNVRDQEVTLVGVDSGAFARVEMHEMAMHKGLMRMREIADVALAPGGLVRFEPGGMHLMLMEPKEDVLVGDEIELTLRFSSGRTQKVSVEVAIR